MNENSNMVEKIAETIENDRYNELETKYKKYHNSKLVCYKVVKKSEYESKLKNGVHIRYSVDHNIEHLSCACVIVKCIYEDDKLHKLILKASHLGEASSVWCILLHNKAIFRIYGRTKPDIVKKARAIDKKANEMGIEFSPNSDAQKERVVIETVANNIPGFKEHCKKHDNDNYDDAELMKRVTNYNVKNGLEQSPKGKKTMIKVKKKKLPKGG